MKKISLKNAGNALSRAEMRTIMAGFVTEEVSEEKDGGGGSYGVCSNSQGGCDTAANCKRSSGAAGKCGSNATVSCGCI